MAEQNAAGGGTAIPHRTDTDASREQPLPRRQDGDGQSSIETKEGRQGFTGGERLSDQGEFINRHNTAEDRQNAAIPADEGESLPNE